MIPGWTLWPLACYSLLIVLILIKSGSDSTMLPQLARVTEIHPDHDLLDDISNVNLAVRLSPYVPAR
jgi:hypothetical protein